MAKAKATTDDDNTTLGLVIRPEADGDYFHIHLRPSFLHTDTGRFKHLFRDVYRGLCLDNFEVQSQGNQPYGKPLSERYLYGFDVRIKAYALDLRDAEAAVKTLRTVDRRLEKMRASDGHPRTFDEYALRVAKAIGATEFFRPKRAFDPGYDREAPYQRLSLSAGRDYIASIDQQWRAGEWKAA